MAQNLSKTTTDHDLIRRWTEERGGWPAEVESTARENQTGIIRIDFPGYSGEGKLARIDWDEWFRKFDDAGLAFVYEEETSGGERSNFNKLVGRETAAARARGVRTSRRQGGGGRRTADRARSGGRSTASRRSAHGTTARGAARGGGRSRAGTPAARGAKAGARAGARAGRRAGARAGARAATGGRRQASRTAAARSAGGRAGRRGTSKRSGGARKGARTSRRSR